MAIDSESTTGGANHGEDPPGGAREELLAAHRAARARRAAAPLGSRAYLEAVEELGRIEIEIARLGREATPPTI